MNPERYALDPRPTEDAINGVDPETIDGYYDGGIVSFLVELGDVWIADDGYISLRRHTGWTESWEDVTRTVPDLYTIGLNNTDHDSRFFNEYWEDLEAAAHSRECWTSLMPRRPCELPAGRHYLSARRSKCFPPCSGGATCPAAVSTVM
jgi:hypothetical protein